jgi:hypothetical protein
MNKHYCCLAFLLPVVLTAQRLSHHDVVVFDMRKNSAGLWQPSSPRFLSSFNPKGYNNQPKFFNTNELWLTVQTPNDTTQTDIYALDLGAKSVTRVTATTLTAEYSPTLMPGGKRFSAVRVEEDGNQRLWSFPLDGSDNGEPVFSNLLNIGYHCWLHDTLVALFIVGENTAPHTLEVAGIRGQTLRRIASNIGRCLLKTNEGDLAFVQKPTEQTWFLKTWNPVKNTQDIVVKMPAGSEDFTLMPDGAYITGNGPRLFGYLPGRDSEWRELLNLSKYGVKKITRLAAGKDGKLAVVVE